MSRELIGFIPAVSRDASAEQAAVNQTIRSPVVPSMSAKDTTATNIAATGDDRNVSSVDLVITKSRHVDFNLTGEEELGLATSAGVIARDTFAEAFRTLANEIETDLGALYNDASRAYGTAGTTPFNTADDLTDATEVMRILDENGAPRSDRHIVIDHASTARLLGKQPNMFKVNEAGTDLTRRFGQLQDTMGMTWHTSGQTASHTAGTALGASPDYLVDLVAGYNIGDTSIHLDTGSGTHVDGDVITFAGDSNKYIIGTGDATSGDKDIVLNGPGLRAALADDTVSEVGASYSAMMAFSRDAIQLATRTPALPAGGDQADDMTIVTDPVSGLSFEVSVYRQFRQVTYFVGIAWGVKTIKSEHMAILLG